MISPWPALALRNLAALALAAPAACVINNPAFMLDGDSTRTDAASSVGTPGTSVVDASTTADATTDTRPTSTTADTLPVDTTADVTTGGPSTSEVSTTAVPDTDGCAQMEVKIPAEADGFYIAGGTDGGTTCMYAEPVAGKDSACKFLNFGATHGMRVARGANAFDAMYAVRFSKPGLLKLKNMGVTSAIAELAVNVYAPPPAIEMRVGMLKEQWFEGVQNGTVAKIGDSNFGSAKIEEMVDTKWSDSDGPRGASSEVTTLFVPANYPHASFLKTGGFSIDAWLAAPDQAEGLVVSFFKDDAVGAEGPSINTRDHPDPAVHPFLLVRFCVP